MFEDSAPVADITLEHCLYRRNSRGEVVDRVRRLDDGGLWATESNWSFPVGPAALTRWMEQDGAVLTWQPDGASADPVLCLLDSAGNRLWQHSGGATPPPAAPHEHGGPAMGLGARLRRQSLTSPSGTHTLLHRADGNLELYCAEAETPVWATGTDWVKDGWAELTADGDLVLATSFGAPVWRSGTAGRGGERLAVADDGTLSLLDAAGTAVWQAGAHTCTAAGHTPPRGSTLHRGQRLENCSLSSPDGRTVLYHHHGDGLKLFRADGVAVWSRAGRFAPDGGLALDEDGNLHTVHGGNALEHLAAPGDHLAVVDGGEIRLCSSDGTVLWREGCHVVDDPDAITAGLARTAPSAALEELLNTDSTPIVRTDFSDGAAWETAWADITLPREFWDEEFTLDATVVARPEFAGWTGEELAALLEQQGTHGHVFVVDAVTLASAEHSVLVVEIDDERDDTRSFRALPRPLIDVEIQLSLANMDWEDFSESADPDGVLRMSFAD